MELDLRVERNDDRAVVHVGGELDLATCPQLRGVLAELVDQGLYHLVVDLEQVSFLDSSGIGVLLGVYRSLQEHDGSLRLTAPSARVRRVLELTGMTKVLPICSPHEATLIEPLDPLAPSNLDV